MPEPFVYHSTRHYAPDTEAYDTLEEALCRAWYDFAYGEAYGKKITQGGRVLYDNPALLEDWGKRDDATGKYTGAARAGASNGGPTVIPTKHTAGPEGLTLTNDAEPERAWVVLVNEHGDQWESIAGVFLDEAAAEAAVADLERRHPGWVGCYTRDYPLDELADWTGARPAPAPPAEGG